MEKLPTKIPKNIVLVLLFLIATGSWVYSWIYYQENRTDIWLQVEEVVKTLTFPIKIAALYTEEPVTAIPVPVSGIKVSQIADTWGEARSNGRIHEGVDMFAERGTPVYAATEGYVIYTGRNNLGGNIVFTVGPGGVRYYYAHLDRVAYGISFGTPVTTDTVVGFVGNTGNAESTPPHLHFGIYHHGPQNPFPLLVDRD